MKDKSRKENFSAKKNPKDKYKKPKIEKVEKSELDIVSTGCFASPPICSVWNVCR